MPLDPHAHLLCDVIAGRHAVETLSREEWQGVARSARGHHLLPYLYWRSQKPGLKRAYRQAVARDLIYLEAQLLTARTLAEAGIEAVWLKGGALRFTVYPEPALRVMVDLDALVHHADRWRALEALQQAGFELMSTVDYLHDPNSAAKRDKHHHFALHYRKYPWVIVEAHFHLVRIADELAQSAEQTEWLMAQAVPTAVQDQVLLFPRPEAHLTYLCAHIALQHGLREIDLRWLLDIHLLVSEHTLEWDDVIADAARMRWSYAVERTLTLTRYLFGTAIPDSVIIQLDEAREPDEDVYHVQIRETSGIAWDMFWTWFRASDFRDKWQFILPDKAYMRQQYEIGEHEAVWPYYIKRWGAQIKRLTTMAVTVLRVKLRSN